MEWPTIITLILGSSVVSVVITNVVTWYRQNQSRNRHNAFLALTLAHKYELYASRCADYLSDHDLFKASKGAAGSCMEFPPELELAPDADFHEFDLELLDAVLEFPGKVRFASDEARFYLDVSGHDDATQVSYKNTATLGIEALNLAKRLRKRYGLASRELRFGKYDLKHTLEEFQTKQPLNE